MAADPEDSSAHRARVSATLTPQAKDEQHYGEVDVVLLFIEDARRRAEKAAAELRAGGAEDFLVEALEQVQAELSGSAKKLIQGTFFAVPREQLTL